MAVTETGLPVEPIPNGLHGCGDTADFNHWRRQDWVGAAGYILGLPGLDTAVGFPATPDAPAADTHTDGVGGGEESGASLMDYLAGVVDPDRFGTWYGLALANLDRQTGDLKRLVDVYQSDGAAPEQLAALVERVAQLETMDPALRHRFGLGGAYWRAQRAAQMAADEAGIDAAPDALMSATVDYLDGLLPPDMRLQSADRLDQAFRGLAAALVVTAGELQPGHTSVEDPITTPSPAAAVAATDDAADPLGNGYYLGDDGQPVPYDSARGLRPEHAPDLTLTLTMLGSLATRAAARLWEAPGIALRATGDAFRRSKRALSQTARQSMNGPGVIHASVVGAAQEHIARIPAILDSLRLRANEDAPIILGPMPDATEFGPVEISERVRLVAIQSRIAEAILDILSGKGDVAMYDYLIAQHRQHSDDAVQLQVARAITAFCAERMVASSETMRTLNEAVAVSEAHFIAQLRALGSRPLDSTKQAMEYDNKYAAIVSQLDRARAGAAAERERIAVHARRVAAAEIIKANDIHDITIKDLQAA